MPLQNCWATQSYPALPQRLFERAYRVIMPGMRVTAILEEIPCVRRGIVSLVIIPHTVV